MEAAGGFDLDPCAATADRRRARVKARVLLTAEDDGLSAPWRGRVFVNPPYGRSLRLWARKCASEAATGWAVVVGLLSAWPDTDTRWWHDHVADKARCSCCADGCNSGMGVSQRLFRPPSWSGAAGKSW